MVLVHNVKQITNTNGLYCEFDLPWPPSVNHYLRFGKGRHYLKKEVLVFRDVVNRMFEGIYSIGDVPFKLELHYHPKTRRKFDLDNFFKQVIDALMHAELFDDDSQLVELKAFKHEFDSSMKGLVHGKLFLA